MTFGFAMFFLQIGTSLRSYEVGTSLRSYEVGTQGQNLALLLPAGLPEITIQVVSTAKVFGVQQGSN
jgi:hypothetical protein